MSLNEPEVEKLNTMLSTEMSASKTYEQAMQIVEDDIVREQIADCESSHKQRAEKLRECIEELGATPVEEGEVWSTVAEICSERAAKDKDAVSALVVGEDSNLQMYKEVLETADEEVRDLLLDKLLPAQEYTHDALNILKMSMQ